RDEIRACLASLPEVIQGRKTEVFVVDNSSREDGCAEIVQTAFPHVNYLAPASNLGFGRANNLGYARSRGEFVLFLNPDTVSNEAALSHCIARLRADERIGLISPKLVQAAG